MPAVSLLPTGRGAVSLERRRLRTARQVFFTSASWPRSSPAGFFAVCTLT